MKRRLSMILALILTCALGARAEAPEAVPAGNALGFAVLEALCDGSENQVISPVSLAYALAMTAQGARGETRQEILDALGAEDAGQVSGLMEPLADAGLRQANAAFSFAGEVREDYIDALQADFDAQWFVPEGSVADAVNAWVSEHTDGLIERMMDAEPDSDAMLTLLNTVAMDAQWASPFVEEDTNEDVFHGPEGDVIVPFMHQTSWMAYGERDGVKMVRLDYRDSTLQLMIALPEEGGLADVLAGLRGEGLGYFRFDGNSEVILSMPRLDLSADNLLNEVLMNEGIQTAFGSDADLSGIADGDLSVDQVRQKARVIFDEEGTRAAASTEISIKATAMMPSALETFDLNRPFAFVIADSATGAVCFAGAVVNPQAN